MQPLVLIHLVQRFMTCSASEPQVQLIDLRIDELRPAKSSTVVYGWAGADEQLIVNRMHYKLLGAPRAYRVVSY